MATTAPRVRDKRLSQNDRDQLNLLANKLINPAAEREAVNAAYVTAAAAIRKMLAERFPEKDMKVLARYDKARPDRCINIWTDAYNFERFEFRTEEEAPLRPTTSNCNRTPFMLDGEGEKAFDAWLDATKALKMKRKALLGDYAALIANAATFNQLVEFWPEAEQLREAIVGRSVALTVLNNDVIARIQADVAQRQAA